MRPFQFQMFVVPGGVTAETRPSLDIKMNKKSQSIACRGTVRRIKVLAHVFCAALVLVACADRAAVAQEVQWIWAAEHKPDQIPQTSCFFRKSFRMVNPELGQLQISANDGCEIYFNGKYIGAAQGSERTTRFDLTDHFIVGINVIAIKVDNTKGATAGLAAAVVVKEKDETKWRMLPTDETWRASLQQSPRWIQGDFADAQWNQCQVVRHAAPPTPGVAAKAPTAPPGLPTETPPALENEPVPTAQSELAETELAEPKPAETLASQTATDLPTLRTTDPSPAPAPDLASPAEPSTDIAPTITAERPTETSKPEPEKSTYAISSEFAVSTIVDNSIGSLIAMEFDEWGRLICSREGGGLVRFDFRLPADSPDRIKSITDKVNSCQGILALNGNIYVTGQGPDGLALYRLSDGDNNGSLDQVKSLLKFKGSLGEHGPHGIALGPDGYIYIVVGNASGVAGEVAASSPYASTYEADIVPRVEDPGGHAVGVKAPGGTIARMRLDGSGLEIYAGGIRNAYDLAFDGNGELFIHDSDMETDIGTAWYRQTNVFQVQPGAEIGWRSGWASFNTDQPDCIAPIADTGRGSPTGIVAYNHLAFPRRYHNSLFLGDWSEGRILNVSLSENGGTYKTKTEVFLQSQPLNVTDLAVGPDGALYFCTGGRGTSGGVFRITWLGDVPAEVMSPESRKTQLLTFPQPQSAWARQALAKTKLQMGDEWKTVLEAAVVDQDSDAKYRVRALELLTLYGPSPSKSLIQAAVEDTSPLVRARAALIMGSRSKASSEDDLIELLADVSPLVRRVACDSLARVGSQPALAQIAGCLKSTDRSEAFAARRLLEKLPVESWRDEALRSEEIRIVIQSSLALMISHPNTENAYKVLARTAELLSGFISDEDFTDLLRVVQLALTQGHVDPAQIPAFVKQLSSEFPTKNARVNTEMAKILAYLNATDTEHRYATYFADSADSVQDKLHVAMMLQTIGDRLDSVNRHAILLCIEQAFAAQGAGSGYYAYLSAAAENLARLITNDDLEIVLEKGEQWPHALVAAFYLLPEKLPPEIVERLIQIDQAPATRTDAATRKMHAGILALLAGADGEAAVSYLRKAWQTDETHRNDIALALAQRPDGDNWAYLVSSLSSLDKETAGDVIVKLISVNRRPRDGKYYRELIQLGLRLKDSGTATIALLEHWTQQKLTDESANWQTAIQVWQKWYEKEFPGEAPISKPDEPNVSGKWTSAELISALSALDNPADVSRGQRLFSTAQCAKCHRYGMIGESMGPELTSLAGRFTRADMIDATINPSKIVSDQYRGKKISLTNGQTLNGLVTIGPNDSWIVLKTDGERVKIPAEEVDDISELQTSTMPEGLLDKLSAREVGDLVHFLESQSYGPAAQTAAANSVETR